MTLYAWGKPRRFPALPPAQPRYFDVAPGTRVLAHCHWQPRPWEHPTLIALHGLESSSDAHYVRGLADKAFAAGFNAVRLNQRNCGGTEHLSDRPVSLRPHRRSAGRHARARSTWTALRRSRSPATRSAAI